MYNGVKATQAGAAVFQGTYTTGYRGRTADDRYMVYVL